MRRFVTELDDDLLPVYPADDTVSAQQVTLGETPLLIEPAGITAVKNGPTKALESYFLQQNYPNPFNPATTIAFSLPWRLPATLKVFDVRGREVATLVDGIVAAGQHSVVFQGTDLPGGIYLYRFNAGAFTQTRKALLLK